MLPFLPVILSGFFNKPVYLSFLAAATLQTAARQVLGSTAAVLLTTRGGALPQGLILAG